MTLPTRRPVLTRALLAPACAAALLAAPAPSLLVAPSAAQEAASAVQDLVLDNVTLGFGETSVSAPRVAVSGTRLSKEELLAIFQGDAKEGWGTRLQRLDAGSLTMPELRVERRGDKRQVVTYRDVTARNIHGGRISELTAAGATLSVEGAAGEPAKASGSYGRIRAEEVDLTALARLYAEAGTARSGFQRLYAALAVDSIAFIDERGTTVSIARLTGRDLAGRQTPATWSGAVESLSSADLSQPDSGKRARAAGLIADLAESVSVGSLEASDIAVKEVKGPDPLNFAIGKFSYTGNGAEAGVSLADVSFGSAEARGKIGRLGLTGFSLEPTIATLRRLAKGAPEKSAPDKLADSKPGEKATPVPPPADPAAQEVELRRLTPVIGTLTLSDLNLDVAGHGQDPAAKPAPMHLGVRGGSITFGPPKDGVPTASRLSLNGLTLPASAVESVPGLGSLGLYGYRDLDLDVIADTAWNEGTKELSFNELSLTGKDMGRLRLNATLGGIGPDVFDPDAAVSGFAMLSATAKALDLTLENGGLFDRFITAQAKTLSLKPDELRKEYVTASVIGVPVILGNSAAAKAIGAAMGKFVSKPGTLSISAKAKNGDGLGMVDVSTAPTPAAVLDKLEVNAKAE